MKKILWLILLVTIICVIITFIILICEAKDPSIKDIDNIENEVFSDAYITSCSGGNVYFVYEGDEYKAKGKLDEAIKGRADIIIENGKISKVDIVERAKKPNSHEISKEMIVSEKKIRVLLKNKDSNYFDEVHIKSKDDIFSEDRPLGKDIYISEILKKHKEIKLNSKTSQLLYFNGKGYEGNLIIKKYKKGYVVISELSIEAYVKYVLPSEMPIVFEFEALKAQAICARTFAYMQIGNKDYAAIGADLDDSVSFQVYNSSGTFEITNKAVEETRGKIITYDDKPISCYYFSTSHGKTENMKIWGTKTPQYIKCVESKDRESPYYRWTAFINVKKLFSNKYGDVKNISILEKSENGTAIKLEVQYKEKTCVYSYENEIRNYFKDAIDTLLLADSSTKDNVSSLPSACFEIEKQDEDTYILNGAGFGHGIGMSQYGANRLAKSGKKCFDIIKYYYKDVKIQNGE